MNKTSSTSFREQALSSKQPISHPLRFRYKFDSSKARQTVRWRRFQGLEFAPEKRAFRAGGAIVPGCIRSKKLPGLKRVRGVMAQSGGGFYARVLCVGLVVGLGAGLGLGFMRRGF